MGIATEFAKLTNVIKAWKLLTVLVQMQGVLMTTEKETQFAMMLATQLRASWTEETVAVLITAAPWSSCKMTYVTLNATSRSASMTITMQTAAV